MLILNHNKANKDIEVIFEYASKNLTAKIAKIYAKGAKTTK